MVSVLCLVLSSEQICFSSLRSTKRFLCTLFFVSSPPNVTSLGEGRGLDDLRGHPRVGAGRGHPRGVGALAGEAEVGDLERLEAEVVLLAEDALEDEDYKEGFVKIALAIRGSRERLDGRGNSICLVG